jgi:sugar phosphate isomerase/epimerase
VWEEWFRKFLRISVELGARGAGSHFGILSVTDCKNPRRKKYIVEEGINAWQRLSIYAKKLGLEFLMFEPMSIEREMASTINDTKDLLQKVNCNSGIPVYLCLDVDHGSNISGDPRDRDPYAWLEELGKFSPVVHIKQSLQNKGGHWPFTREYNRRGIIRPQKVIKALEESGAGHVVLCLEISHRERYPAEDRVVKDLKESADYWKRFI